MRSKAFWLLFGSLIAAAAFVFLRGDKYFLVAYARLTAPRITSISTQPKHTNEYLFDFTDAMIEGNLSIDSNALVSKESFFQLDSPHTLKLMHIADAPILLQSFGTFIDYSKGRFSWLKVQIERDLVTYAEALESAKAHAKILQLEDQVNISGYATHLGPVEDSETWIPVVRLPNAVVWILLNCNWERMSEAREQLQKVTCRPTLNFSPPE